MSKPYFSEFVPLPGSQSDVIGLVYNHNYGLYTPEILLSGSVGSSKSITMAHIAISHCLRWPGARAAISRQSLPDLKKTLYKEIIEHLELDPRFIENVHYTKSDNIGYIRFANGSEVISVSFGDKRYGRVRSLKLSLILIEEGTEFDDSFYEEGSGFMQFKARLRRIWNVPENLLIVATNPDEPEHFLHKYFIEGSEKYDSRYVFYSLTEDNIYLDPLYVKQLKQDYSPLEAERFLRGRWISLFGKGIYHSYSEKNEVKGTYWRIKRDQPIHINFDFNVAQGKPMSACVFQYVKPIYHVFTESIIDNSNYCIDCLEDFEAKHVLSKRQKIIIHGDATGSARSQTSLKSNYDLIRDWLTHRNYTFEILVPMTNPAITTRHTVLNAILKNDLNQVRMKIYPACKTLKLGLKLTKLKPNTRIEDDSKRYQHVTTALGYGVYYHKTRYLNRSTGNVKIG